MVTWFMMQGHDKNTLSRESFISSCLSRGWQPDLLVRTSILVKSGFQASGYEDVSFRMSCSPTGQCSASADSAKTPGQVCSSLNPCLGSKLTPRVGSATGADNLLGVLSWSI